MHHTVLPGGTGELDIDWRIMFFILAQKVPGHCRRAERLSRVIRPLPTQNSGLVGTHRVPFAGQRFQPLNSTLKFQHRDPSESPVWLGSQRS